MALLKFLQPYLWSYDLSQMNPKEDKITIITQILNVTPDLWFYKFCILDIKSNPKLTEEFFKDRPLLSGAVKK